MRASISAVFGVIGSSVIVRKNSLPG
jgi:hypothetical protein